MGFDPFCVLSTCNGTKPTTNKQCQIELEAKYHTKDKKDINLTALKEKKNKQSPLLKYTEIDLRLPTFKSMKEEYENGERRRLRFKVSLRQEVTKASKVVDCVELAESR